MYPILAGLAETNIEFDRLLKIFACFTVHGGEQAMNALLTLADRPTAVLAFSDEMAFGAMRSLSRWTQAGDPMTLKPFAFRPS